MAFQAPALFLGDQSAAYGGTLHLEQRLLTSDGANYPMVLLSDGTLFLQFRTTPPGTDWTAYDIPLVVSAGWEVSDLSDTADPDPPATEAQLQQVLGNLTLFNIWADWLTGSDRVDLDNVRLESSNDGPLNVQLVKDLVEGPTGSSPFIGAVVNGVLFFGADHPDFGRQLWKTDGTAEGTVLVKDGIDFGQMHAIGESLLFRADDGVHGTELWISDGTAGGTRMVKDIRPGRTSTASFLRMAELNGKVIFSYDDGTNGMEMWVSDGTEAGTVLLKDILPGSGASTPDHLTNVDGRLFFTAIDGVVGRELWVTDGTEAGTMLVKDLTPGMNGSGPLDLTEAGGKLFFSHFSTGNGIELWVSDGTAAGTNQVKDIFPGNCSPFAVQPCSGSPSELVEMDDTLYFRGNSSLGAELWKSDGTFDGTVIVKDINEGSEESFPSSLINVGGTLMFFADGPETGFELWKSDGSEAGTLLVKDINAGPDDSARLGDVSSMAVVGNILYFIGCDQSDSQGDPTNCELWRSDGTAEGTFQVHDFGPAVNDRDPLSSGDTPGNLFDFDGTLVFAVDDGIHGEELWKLTSELLPGESVYSFRDDFSTTANPAGPWSYGFLDPLGDFQLHPDGSLHSDGQFKWHGPGVPDALGFGLPAVFSLLVHPGSNGEKSAVRWTAPADGLYEIEVTFSDADNATTDVAVLHQSQLLSSSFVNLNGQVDVTSFSLTQFVFAGQTIDFVVGDGGNGYISDSTGLDATITLVTAVTFSAAADFSATENPAGPWSYGWLDPDSGTFSLFPESNLDPETGVVEWNDSATFDLVNDAILPAVFYNAGDSEAFVATCEAVIEPGQLALHPGRGAEASTVRWTAPAAGTYSVTATFTGADFECRPTATVFVLHNTGASEPSELFFDLIDTHGDVAAFSGSVTVAAGETLDFLVNDGGNGQFGDTIILDVVILGAASTPPPAPPSPGAGAVTFSLDPGAPEGAAIDPETGVFTWTPAAEHGPGAYIVTVRVTDEGTPPVSTTQTFLVTVVDPNEAPQIAAIDPVSVEQGATLAIDVLATDPDVPANRIAFSLDEGAPAEASIDPRTGRFTWRPLRSTEPGTYEVTVRATDDGEPALDATATFSITVTERALPPSRDPEAGSFVIDPDGVAVYTKADTFQHVDRLAYLDDDGDDGVNLVTAEFTSEPFRNVSSLYEDLLGRGASDGEVIDWTGRLDDATFRGVAGEFLASREYVQNVVQELFESLLDRPADPGGLDFWTGQLLGGTPADTVRALIVASEEYFAQHASAREDFVVGLYEDLLERAPGEEEVAFWRTTLEQGATRDAVAQGFLASAEFRALLIQEWYRDYLYREADEAGVDHWLSVMNTSQAQRQVQLELLASQEYQSEERLARGRLPRVIGPFEPD
ncbi:MAG: ELWxxDGT repeat protein [Pirellulales bacterium]